MLFQVPYLHHQHMGITWEGLGEGIPDGQEEGRAVGREVGEEEGLEVTVVGNCEGIRLGEVDGALLGTCKPEVND